MKKSVDDLAENIRKTLYQTYQNICEKNKDKTPEEWLMSFYEVMKNTYELEPETYYEQIGTLLFDYYVKYKNFVQENDMVRLIEEVMDLEEMGQLLMDPKIGGFYLETIVDEVIDDYEDDYSFEYFHDLFDADAALMKEITYTYHPESEVFLDSYKAYLKRLKYIETFEHLDMNNLQDITLSYHVLAHFLEDEKDAMDQLCFKFDGYKDHHPKVREELIKKVIAFYYSCTKKIEEEEGTLTSFDFDLLSLIETEDKDFIIQFLDVDENMPYVNRMLEVLVQNYEGKETVDSTKETVRQYVKSVKTKMEAE